MKRKQAKSENYLERIPIRSEKLTWSTDEKGMVTLDIENRGAMNRLAQRLLKKPKVSHIHLDEMGSFVWPLIDGERSVLRIGELVEEHFGEKAHPTYERIAKYFEILHSYHFVSFSTQNTD